MRVLITYADSIKGVEKSRNYIVNDIVQGFCQNPVIYLLYKYVETIKPENVQGRNPSPIQKIVP